MKVYVVFDDILHEHFICQIFLHEEDAQRFTDVMNIGYPNGFFYEEIEVVE